MDDGDKVNLDEQMLKYYKASIQENIKLKADNKRLKEALSDIEELTILIDKPDKVAKAIFREIEEALTDKE